MTTTIAVADASPTTDSEAAPKDLAQLVAAIESELFDNEHQKHLPLHKKTHLQTLLECVSPCLLICLSV